MSVDALKGFEQFMARALKDMNVVGCSVAVVQNGEIILADGYGYADLESKTALTPDHIFPIASATKAFTSTSVCMLAGEGKVDLDKPLRNYLPEFNLSDPIAAMHATPRDLLCHRTGMPRHDLMWIGWEDLSRKELVERLRHLPASKPFRSTWQYQNHMYATLGYLIEKLSGKTWESFVEERIFKPLDMKTASTAPVNKGKGGMNATLYRTNKEETNEVVEPLLQDGMSPAGSINASILDMAKWALFNLAGGKVGEEALVAESVFPQLHKPNIPYELSPIVIPEVRIGGYGLGWIIDFYRGEKLVEHGGNLHGASSLVAMLPEKNIGCVVLTNAHGTALTHAVVYEVFDRLLGYGGAKDWVNFYIEAQKPMKEAMTKQMEERKAGAIPNKPACHEAEEYLGTYTNPGYGNITVRRDEKNGDYSISRYGKTYPMIHRHYDIFMLDLMEMPFAITFNTGVNGKIVSFSAQFEPSCEPIIFVKE